MCTRFVRLQRYRQQTRIAALRATVVERELLVQQAQHLVETEQLTVNELRELEHYLETAQSELACWQAFDTRLMNFAKQVSWGDASLAESPILDSATGQVAPGYQLTRSPELQAARQTWLRANREVSPAKTRRQGALRSHLLQAHRDAAGAYWQYQVAEHLEVLSGFHWHRRNFVQRSAGTTKYVSATENAATESSATENAVAESSANESSVAEGLATASSPSSIKRQLCQLTHAMLSHQRDQELRSELAAIAAERAQRRLVRLEALEQRDLATDQQRYELLAASVFAERHRDECASLQARRNELLEHLGERLVDAQLDSVEGSAGPWAGIEPDYASPLWSTPEFVESYLHWLAERQSWEARLVAAQQRRKWRIAQQAELELLHVDGEVSDAELSDAQSHVRQAEIELQMAESSVEIYQQLIGYFYHLTRQPVLLEDLYWGELPLWEVPGRLVESFRPSSRDGLQVASEIWVVEQQLRDLQELAELTGEGDLSWADRRRWADLETQRQSLRRAQRTLRTQQVVLESDRKLLRWFLERS